MYQRSTCQWCKKTTRKRGIEAIQTLTTDKFYLIYFVRSPVIATSQCLKSPTSKYAILRVSSFLSSSTHKSNPLEAAMSQTFSVFPVESLWSGFWTTLPGNRPDDSVIDLTYYIVTWCQNRECIRFFTAIRALSTAFLCLSSKLFSTTSNWHATF